jgi:hypothetical protein
LANLRPTVSKLLEEVLDRLPVRAWGTAVAPDVLESRFDVGLLDNAFH